MYHLPEELIRYIYEFDNTYIEYFNECLRYICKFCIYHSESLNVYYIYNPENNILHMTNDLKKPNYICSSFGIHYEKFKELLNTTDIKRDYNLKLEYNVELFLFHENYI